MPDIPFDILVPVQQQRAEDGPDGRVTILVPRFTGRLTRRWILPMLRRPHVRVHLDETGSFVWRQCDGRTSVAEITARVRDRLGVDERDAQKRVVMFLQRLIRADSIQLLAPSTAARSRSS